jgi:hypothetical protein
MGRDLRSPGLTNIGTTVPPVRPLTEPAQRFQPGTGQGLPVAMPVADGQGGVRYVAPEPLWTSRWQPSASPPGSERPWVVGFRWYYQGVVYDKSGLMPYFRIDFLWRTAAWGYPVPHNLFVAFQRWTGSVGQWWHQHIAGPGWSRGKPTRISGFPVRR